MATALSWDALTNVETMRSYLQREKTGTLDGRFTDDWMTQLINHTSAAIGLHCNRQLIAPAADMTYLLDGEGESTLLLPEYPIVSLTSITNLSGPEVIPARPTVNDDGYSYGDAYRMAGQVKLCGYVADWGSSMVQVVGRLGYTTGTPVGTATWTASSATVTFTGVDVTALIAAGDYIGKDAATLRGATEQWWKVASRTYAGGNTTVTLTASYTGATATAATSREHAQSVTQTRYARANMQALAQLEHACLEWGSLLFNAPVPSVEVTSVDQVAFTVREQGIPTRVRTLLEPYRRGLM